VDLKLLRAFLEVASEGHFGRAADVLEVTQPALTQRVQALERNLGAQLFTRSPREVRLTPAGEILLPYASGLAQIEEHMLRDLADHAAGRGGRLRLGYLTQADVITQSKIVAEFRRRYPRATLETSSANSHDGMLKLTAGELDVAFVDTPVNTAAGIVVRVISPFPFVLAMPDLHPFAQLDKVPVRSLRSEPLILPPALVNPALVSALHAWLARHIGAKPNIVAEEPAAHAIEAVAQLRAIAIVSGQPRASTPAVPGILFRPLTPAPLTYLAVAYLRDDPAPLITSLLRTVDEVGLEEAGELPADAEPI
jgi:DNA-binding transcriptional LysR family regulator